MKYAFNVIIMVFLCYYANSVSSCGITLQNGQIPPINLTDFDMSISGPSTQILLDPVVFRQVQFNVDNCFDTGAHPSSVWVSRNGLPASEGLYDGYNYYATEYDNIKYIVSIKQVNGSVSNWKSIIDTPEWLWYSSYKKLDPYSIDVKVRFLFLGPIRAGVYTVKGRKVGEALVSEQSTQLSPVVSTDLRYNSFSFTVTGASCELDASDETQTVRLPTVSSDSFSGVGSFVGATSFSIKLKNCPVGVKIYAAMSDSNSAANTSNALTLNSSSTASGVGIQILLNDDISPIDFGLQNQWGVEDNATVDATFNVRFIAQYVQTHLILTPGTINAMATVSFFYE